MYSLSVRLLLLIVCSCIVQAQPVSSSQTKGFGEVRQESEVLLRGEALGVVSSGHLRHRAPREAKRSFDRAFEFVRRNQPERAAEALESAIRSDPGFAEAHGELGVQYARLGRVEEAEAEFKDAIRLDPSYWILHYNLALVLLDRGSQSEAEEYARRALQMSNNAFTQMGMGLVLSRNPETKSRAEAYLKSAARTLPLALGFLRQLNDKH
ncbi:MAG TPA: tetratricopeptide repeat protein [Bryobacteraceae bacterium]|jgi:Tfp pilus assembly protein PilF